MTTTPFTSGAEGVFYDVPSSTYFAESALSHSLMKELSPTPAHGLAYMLTFREPKPSQLIGTLTHSLILEPEKPLPAIAIQPDEYPDGKTMKKWTYTSNYCKGWRSEQVGKGLIVLPRTGKDSYEEIVGMATAASRHPLVREYLSEGVSEVSLFTHLNTAYGPIRGKARLDFVPKAKRLIDFKTTQDASEPEFSRALVNFRYASQAAWYLNLWDRLCGTEDKRREFTFFAIEKAPPYLVADYTLDEDALRWGYDMCLKDMDTYAKCSQEGVWPGYPTNRKIGLPSYMKRNS